jgi:hypothetical protein
MSSIVLASIFFVVSLLAIIVNSRLTS